MNLSPITLSVLLLVSAPAAAQEPVAPPVPVQAAGYKIGQEDEIRLLVVGEDQFNNVYRIQADGTITVPFIGDVKALGRTTVELTSAVRSALIEKGFIRDPQVRIDVSKYGSQFVMVQGEVRIPSRIPMSGSMTLLEALAAAGYQTPSAGTTVTIARRLRNVEGGPSAKDAETITVSLADLGRGAAGADRPLTGGDIITVSKAETLYVSGEVKLVGVQNWEPGLTVNQAITKAGGVTDRGRDSGIKIRRIVEGKPKEIEAHMTDLVQPNDEVVVPRRRL
jgi:polysaccharide export outer membrane protein